MKRERWILINFIIITALIFLFFYVQKLYLSPLSAHKDCERSMLYGPSNVVHTEDYDNWKLILSKYDKWVSCDSVSRKFFFLWGPSEYFSVLENDKTKAVSYKWDLRKFTGEVYGIVNDPNVKKIDILLADGKVLSTTNFYDNLFLFSWKFSYSTQNSPRKVIGYDSNGKVIFDTF